MNIIRGDYSMKIDTHVHVTPPDVIKHYKKIGETEAYFNLLSSSPQNRFATAQQVVAHMKEVNIDYSVVFGFSFQDMGLCQYVNDYVMEAVKTYPSQLIGFASVVPNHPKIEAEIERCYQGGLRGIGELFPAGQPFDIADPKHTNSFAKACEYFKMPVIVHTNEPIGHDYVGKTETSLKDIEAFVHHHPELKIVLAHWGGGLFFYELMKEVKAHFSNVYYDNAATIFLYDPKIYQVAKQLGIMDKLLFGSDYPLLSPVAYEKGLMSSGLTEEDLELLYSKNAMKLLKHIPL